jgi:hypothetical protein
MPIALMPRRSKKTEKKIQKPTKFGSDRPIYLLAAKRKKSSPPAQPASLIDLGLEIFPS